MLRDNLVAANVLITLRQRAIQSKNGDLFGHDSSITHLKLELRNA
jgi:hypothetical protein